MILYKIQAYMQKVSPNPLLLILSMILAIGLIASLRHSNKLVAQKEILILKNDSLHVLQIKSRNELELMQTHVDSLSKIKGRKFFTFK